MNDLPNPSGFVAPQGANPPSSSGGINASDIQGVQISPGVGLGTKEMEPSPGFAFPEQTGLVETHKDIELPPEIVRAGVSVQPTQVPLPQAVQSAGVAPVGNNVSIGSGTAASMPLTDDQIAQGLKTSVAESWRWLAEWCLKKIKQMRLVSVMTDTGKKHTNSGL